MCPEDIFGTDKDARHQKIMFHMLAREIHPDLQKSDNDKKIASEAIIQLVYFYALARERMNDGTYGKRITAAQRLPIIIGGKYVREKSFVVGDIADLHFGSRESGAAKSNLILKVARVPKDNDLLLREAEALKIFKNSTRLQEAPVASAFPQLIDSFEFNEGGAIRRVNVMNNMLGFLSGMEVRQRFFATKGVDGRTIAWMWKRILVVLDWTHHLGLLHGAVLPPHVLFYPDNDGTKLPNDPRKHSLRLVDWCYSINPKERTKLKAFLPAFQHLYAPEIIAKEKLSPATDLYMAAQTMLYLSDGDLPEPLRRNITACLVADPRKRPQDAGDHFVKALHAVNASYGARRWHEFTVPGGI